MATEIKNEAKIQNPADEKHQSNEAEITELDEKHLDEVAGGNSGCNCGCKPQAAQE